MAISLKTLISLIQLVCFPVIDQTTDQTPGKHEKSQADSQTLIVCVVKMFCDVRYTRYKLCKLHTVCNLQTVCNVKRCSSSKLVCR